MKLVTRVVRLTGVLAAVWASAAGASYGASANCTTSAISATPAPVSLSGASVFGALWRTGEGYATRLVLKNSGEQAVSAQILVYSAAGGQLGSEQIALAANSAVPVQIDSLIPATGTIQWGGLEVQLAGAAEQLAGQVTVTEPNGATESYALQGGYRYDTENALWAPWWLPDEGTNGTITLFNTSAQSIMVTPSTTVNEVEASGKPTLIAAHASAALDLRSLLAESDNGTTWIGSVTLRYTGPAHALEPTLLLANPETGFALMPDFGARHTQQTGQQTSWQFPYVPLTEEVEGGVSGHTEMLSSYALLSNGTKMQMTPQITAYVVSSGTVQRVPFSVAPLEPNQSRLVDLSALAQQLPTGISRMALTVSHSGQPGDLGISILTLAADGQVLAKSEGLILAVPAADISYWDISSGKSLLHWIRSVSGDNATAQATLYYQGFDGLRSYEIPAALTADNNPKPLNLSLLLRTGIPDDSASRLPPAIASGLVVLRPMGNEGSTLASHLPTCSSTCTSQVSPDVLRAASSSPVVFEQSTASPVCTGDPTVSISGPTLVPISATGHTNIIQLTATGSPSGGTYSWNSSNSAFTLSNSDTGTVTVSSSSPGDSTISVTYTVTEQEASDSQTVTVQVPSYFVTSSYVHIATPSACTDAGYTGYYLTLSNFVADQNGTQIMAAGIDPQESVSGAAWMTAYATPATTTSSGTFSDTPFGACFAGAPPGQYCQSGSTDTHRASYGSTIYTIPTVYNSTECTEGEQVVITGNRPSQNQTIISGTVN
jgi:hypothetical protein